MKLSHPPSLGSPTTRVGGISTDDESTVFKLIVHDLQLDAGNDLQLDAGEDHGENIATPEATRLDGGSLAGLLLMPIVYQREARRAKGDEGSRDTGQN